MKRERLFLSSVILALVALSYLVASQATANGPGAKTVTFNKDVAPIFYNNCAHCHRVNDIAPMSLITYKETRPWSRSIREKVIRREMPPWHADPNHGEFLNDRRLTQSEINTIVAWVDQGAKEGDPKDLPPAPQFNGQWRHGKPDIILAMPQEYTLAAEGPDEYKYFEIPTNFKEDVWVQAVESIPGNRKIVHHIIAFVQPPQPNWEKNPFKPSKEAMENFRKQLIFQEDGTLVRVKPDIPVFDNGCATPEGGAGIFRDGTVRDNSTGMIGGEAPGSEVFRWPTGMAKKIPAGSKIILQMHYARNGKVEKDRSSVGLYLAKEPPDKEVRTEMVTNYHFQIPPQAASHAVTACFTFKADAHVIGLMPHMHLRGKDMKVEAFYPDGKSEVLISVPNYSFNWQTNYYLKSPKALPKGTRIEVTAHFDNSAGNKYNPDPTKPVRFGDPTYDEMMIAFVDYTLDSERLSKPDAAGKATEARK